MPIELERLDQPLLGVDAIRGQVEELAGLLHDKKLFQLKDLLGPNRLAHINRTPGTSVDAATGVVYAVPDHSGASGTPAVWTLCDWLESEGVLVESPSLKTGKQWPGALARTAYQLRAIG